MPAPSSQESGSQLKVLVVDDHDDNRTLLRAVLKRQGVQVFEAEDGVEGIKMAYLNRPDLILMDISMPVMDGLESVRQLKGVELTRSIPVVVVSAHCGDPAMKKKALDAGCLQCLPKPFNLDDIVAIVDKLKSGS